jgi:ubiquinone/menaquinone biosynthesis C-methylase UbiE
MTLAVAESIRFEDGAGYERVMGVWSRSAGSVFLDWLAAPPHWRWLDVGCGNGAFTELLFERCAPAAATGVDPSAAQLDFARSRPGTPGATYVQGDAMSLPLADASFDAAVMALVLFFVPEPARGVAEMARVVRPGGLVAAYAWDILGGGFPLAKMHEEMRGLGIDVMYPPSVEAAGLANMRALWSGAGLVDVETTTIEVTRTYDDYEDLWQTALLASSIRQRVLPQPAQVQAQLKERLRQRCDEDADARGRITWRARANAVRGRRQGAPSGPG